MFFSRSVTVSAEKFLLFQIAKNKRSSLSKDQWWRQRFSLSSDHWCLETTSDVTYEIWPNQMFLCHQMVCFADNANAEIL